MKAVRFVSRRECRNRKRVLEFTIERSERMKTLVSSCFSEVDRTRMRMSRYFLTERSKKHEVSEFRRAETIETTTLDSKTNSTSTVNERIKTVR